MEENDSKYRIFEHISEVDISEQDIWDYEPDVLRKLLIDHTMSAKAREMENDPTKVVNIFWATNDYEVQREKEAKEGFYYDDQIMPEKIIGSNGRVIMPRILKDKRLQSDRTKDKAEVFTPSWVCNAQNNLIDEAWFGCKDVFNREIVCDDGTHTWISTEGKIEFPEGDKNKTWKKYVTENRLEVTCGEAPYLASRYDTTTGEAIPLNQRIGFLDRKLRVVSENTSTTTEWLEWARKAMMHTYGYEWQGDNLLLAREALLYTFIEYYIDKFKSYDKKGSIVLKVPDKRTVINIAYIISWNLWQMDGIRMVVPDSCNKQYEYDLWGEKKQIECKACKEDKSTSHIGYHCLIRDWNKKKPDGYKFKPGEDPKSSPWQKLEFQTLLSANKGTTEQDDDE